MTPFEKEIRKILNNIDVYDDTHIDEEEVAMAYTAIATAVERIVPEEKKNCDHLIAGSYGACTWYSCHENGGFNDCRTQMLEAINKNKRLRL